MVDGRDKTGRLACTTDEMTCSVALLAVREMTSPVRKVVLMSRSTLDVTTTTQLAKVCSTLAQPLFNWSYVH
jgi:hypothetical protein